MRKTKILLFSPTLDSDSGGSGRIISGLTTYASNSVAYTIVLFQKKISYPCKGRVIALDIPTSRNFFARMFHFFLTLLKFWNIVRKEKPEYVMSFDNSPNLINIVTCRTSIVRVDSALSQYTKALRTKLFLFAAKILYRRAHHIIAVSKGLARDLQKNFHVPESKIQIIYNPVDRKVISQLRRKSLPREHRPLFRSPVVITLGRMSEEKGQWHLIRAFSLVKMHVPNAKLVILGQGAMEPYLRHLVRDYHMEDEIYLLGWQSNPFPFLTYSKVFVFPSLWEGFGVAIVEAMACGVPVISSDCRYGPREILAPETDPAHQAKDMEQAPYGILTPVCDGKQYTAKDPLTREEMLLSKAMITVLCNEKLSARLRKASQRRAQDFDIKKILNQYYSLYGQKNNLD